MALIRCPECSQSISNKAITCPHCGAPNAQQAGAPISQSPTQQVESVVDRRGTVCPFSGHHIPEEATVCVCGAYFGYKGGIMTDQKFNLLVKLLGMSLVLLFLGYLAEWELTLLIGLFATFVLGTVFLFFGLPTRLQGKQWWREM